MPNREVKVPTPPFWGRRELKLTELQIEMAFEWINHKILFKSRWGYSSKGKTKEEYQKQLDEVVIPAYEELKRRFIDEKLFENRFMHVSELIRMGADITLNGSVAMIKGTPNKLYGANVMATDLRASSALVLAGIIAENETKIHRVYHLFRGYENLTEKLKNIGVEVRLIEE